MLSIASYGVLKGRVISRRSGAVVRIDIVPPVALSNKGGIISILNRAGLKVDDVSYTCEKANRPGWTIVF